MKSSEAAPLTPDELNTLKSLFQRWILRSFPDASGGTSEESDAIQTYISIKEDAERGNHSMSDRETEERIAEYGEAELN